MHAELRKTICKLYLVHAELKEKIKKEPETLDYKKWGNLFEI